MSSAQFSIKQALIYGFKKTYEHMRLFLALEAIIFVGWFLIAIAGVILEMHREGTNPAVSGDSNYIHKLVTLIGSSLFKYMPLFLKNIVLLIIGIAMICVFLFSAAFIQGLRKVMLDIYESNHSEPQRIFSQLSPILPIMFAQLFYSSLVSIGFILLVIPGIYFSAKYGFYGYCLLDNKELGPLGALKQSAKITKGSMMHLCGYSIVWLLLFYVGMLSIIGWIFIFPALMLSYAYIYKHLVNNI